ncbi:MAG: RDD family protein [Acidimicrobiia bacterium]|nr:RDD family protein [Acidimicrobiia bacterium]
MARTIRNDQAAALQGGRAGFVSRVIADAIDLVVVEVIFLAILLGVGTVRFLLTRRNFSVAAPDLWVTAVAQWLILVIYLTTTWSSTGRSVGKSVLGLRVLDRAGRQLTTLRAFLRAVFCAVFYPTLLWIFVSRRNAALHDILLGTQVRYDWTTTHVVPPPT